MDKDRLEKKQSYPKKKIKKYKFLGSTNYKRAGENNIREMEIEHPDWFRSKVFTVKVFITEKKCREKFCKKKKLGEVRILVA